MVLGAVQRVGNDLLHHSSLVLSDSAVADQACVNPPAGQAGQPETAHRNPLSPGRKEEGKVDVSKVVGGGNSPGKPLVTTVTSLGAPGTQKSCFLILSPVSGKTLDMQELLGYWTERQFSQSVSKVISPCKHEELSSDLQHPHKKPGMVVYVYNTRETEISGSLEHAGLSPYTDKNVDTDT